MNHQICKNCFSTDIESNEAKGEVICLNCGTVLEENQIVESLEFVENHNGGISMVGQFIPSGGGKSYIMSMGLRDSKEAALQRGYSNIQKIADHLHLPIQIVEAAQRLYLIALQRNFTMGRNNTYVTAACLYTICRREKSPVMLIDFSDVLQTPMKPLGQTFLKLLRLLHMSVPNIDPSLFLERFAHKLNLKNDIFRVTYTGIKLIQAMTRDWISTGRRPTGLCGAALLIATRIHGISIDPTVIADVVRISKPTLIKRLSEFKNTNAAKIKVADFDHISLNEVPCNKIPPCVVYGSNKKKREDKRNKEDALTLQDTAESDIAPMICDDDSGVLQVTDNPEPTGAEEKEIISQKKGKCLIPEGNSSITGSTRSSTHGNVSDNTSFVMSDNLSSRSSEDLNIQVEEICNENPREEDINNLALKMINTINKENNTNILKNVNLDMLIGGKINNDSTSSNNSYNANTENGSISCEGMQNKLNIFDTKETNLSNDNAIVSSFTNEERLDKLNKDMILQNKKEETILENCINKKYEEPIDKEPIDKEPIDKEPIDKEPIDKEPIDKEPIDKEPIDNTSVSEFSTKSNTINKDLYSDTTLVDINNIMKTDDWGKNNADLEQNKNKEKKQDGENFDEIYNETLKESFNYELNKTLSEIDELPVLRSMLKNEKEGENKIENNTTENKNNLRKNSSGISELLPDLNYFFEEGTANSVNELNENYEINTDEAFVTLNNDTLSDFDTDSEIENMILSEKEKHIKMTIWDDMMKGYMPQYCKQLKRKKKNAGQNIVKKKRKDPSKCVEDETATTGEVVLKALEHSDKHMFNKINCDVLNSMFAS